MMPAVAIVAAIAGQVALESYWREGDGNDYANALDRAIPDAGVETCGSVKIKNRLYRVSRKIDVTGCFEIVGDGGAYMAYDRDATTAGGSFGAPTLWFFNNTGGFELHYPEVPAICGPTHPGMTVASRFTARNITIHGSGHLSGRELHGITAHSRFFLDHVTVRQFGGYGIMMRCDARSVGTPNCGECSLVHMYNVRIYLNGWGGLRTGSGDANAGFFFGLDVNDNGERRYDYGADDVNGTADDCPGAGCTQAYMNTIHQIEDRSQVGNRFYSIHVGGNVNGSDHPVVCGDIDGSGNRCMIIGSYFEGGVEPALAGPGWTLGGSIDRLYPTSTSSNGAMLNSDTTGRLFVENAIGAQVAINQTCASGCVGANLGSTSTNNAAVELLHDNGASSRLRLQYANSQATWWEMIDSGSNSLTSMRIAAPTAGSDRGNIWFPRGAYLGGIARFGGTGVRNTYTVETIGSTEVEIRCASDGSTCRYEGWRSAAPTSGTWPVGSKIWNSAPASGQAAGWICTVAGTPGTWAAMAVLQ